VTLELLRLSTARGKTIAALDYGARRPRGVTLAVGHGYSSSKHNLDLLCAFLAGHGFRVVSIDFPGHKLGASGGALNAIADLTDAMHAAVAHARATAEGAVVIYTMGHSMGATTALRTAAEDPSIAGAIAIATGYGRPNALAAFAKVGALDLRSSYVDGLELAQVAEQTELVLDAALAALAGRPKLIVAASRDGMVSRASVAELFARVPEPKSFATIESDHTYAGEHARAAVLAWLAERHPR